MKKTKIKCPYTEREAVKKIIELIEKYQHIESWEIGIRDDGQVDAITDATRPYGSNVIAVRYFYTTTDGLTDTRKCDWLIEYFMSDGRPESSEYEIEFKRSVGRPRISRGITTSRTYSYLADHAEFLGSSDEPPALFLRRKIDESDEYKAYRKKKLKPEFLL